MSFLEKAAGWKILTGLLSNPNKDVRAWLEERLLEKAKEEDRKLDDFIPLLTSDNEKLAMTAYSWYADKIRNSSDYRRYLGCLLMKNHASIQIAKVSKLTLDLSVEAAMRDYCVYNLYRDGLKRVKEMNCASRKKSEKKGAPA